MRSDEAGFNIEQLAKGISLVQNMTLEKYEYYGFHTVELSSSRMKIFKNLK